MSTRAVSSGGTWRRRLGQELMLVPLRRAYDHGCLEFHHSDQGVQHAATAYVEMLTGDGVKVNMASWSEPEENGYAEMLLRTIKEEGSTSEHKGFGEVLGGWDGTSTKVYNRQRIHSSLGYLTPAEFENEWREKRSASA